MCSVSYQKQATTNWTITWMVNFKNPMTQQLGSTSWKSCRRRIVEDIIHYSTTVNIWLPMCAMDRGFQDRYVASSASCQQCVCYSSLLSIAPGLFTYVHIICKNLTGVFYLKYRLLCNCFTGSAHLRLYHPLKTKASFTPLI